MNDRQENFISMTNKVEIVALKYKKDVWKDNKAMIATFAEIKELKAEIDDAAQRQIYDNSTFIKEKRKARKLTTVEAVIICGIMKSYASATGKEDLYDNVDFNKSKMNALRDSLFIILINFLVKKSTSLLDLLKDYGMTQVLIDSLIDESDLYKEAVAKPQAAIAAKAEATKELRQLFKEIRKTYDESLDNNMLLYLSSHKKFYDEYILAREIYDTGHFAHTLYGHIADAKTKEPVDQAAVTIIRTIEGKVIVLAKTKTSEKGNFQIKKKVEEGMVTVVVECPGYNKYTNNKVRIIKNKSTRLDVKLTKTE